MTVEISPDIYARLELEAARLDQTPAERVNELLDGTIAPLENFDEERIQTGIESISNLLQSIPCINSVAISEPGESTWWLKFVIDIHSRIAWNVIQELGHILNYLSLDERLPTAFYPVSPPPYMNGGPEGFLSWVIESSIPLVDSELIFEYLQGRLPENPDQEDSWILDEGDEN